jgi:hypothetical protein
MLTAALTRPGTISAADITLTHRLPTLALCRALVAAGHPDGPMTVVDSATGRPVLSVASIAAAALLTVDESAGCRFHPWKPFPGVRGAPGVASDDAGVPARGPGQTRSWSPPDGLAIDTAAWHATSRTQAWTMTRSWSGDWLHGRRSTRHTGGPHAD